MTKQGLRQRGWTEALVRDFLGEPDRTKRNPRYAKAAPMQLYAVARVESAEGSAEFAAAKAKSGTRSVAAKIAAETQRRTLLAAARQVCPGAPYLILRQDLELPGVRSAPPKAPVSADIRQTAMELQ